MQQKLGISLFKAYYLIQRLDTGEFVGSDEGDGAANRRRGLPKNRPAAGPLARERIKNKSEIRALKMAFAQIQLRGHAMNQGANAAGRRQAAASARAVRAAPIIPAHDRLR